MCQVPTMVQWGSLELMMYGSVMFPAYSCDIPCRFCDALNVFLWYDCKWNVPMCDHIHICIYMCYMWNDFCKYIVSVYIDIIPFSQFYHIFIHETDILWISEFLCFHLVENLDNLYTPHIAYYIQLMPLLHAYVFSNVFCTISSLCE